MFDDLDLTGISPMMQHYIDTKRQYPDAIVFYRLGDFYEMFFDDAHVASRELELTLTGKNCGLAERAPMCGVPFHSADIYISRLISKGYKVAICEQMEDPKAAKGIVQRDVIRVISQGTTLDNSFLDEQKNNYIMCLYQGRKHTGISVCDVSTGDFYVTEVTGITEILGEIARFSPSEMIGNRLGEADSAALDAYFDDPAYHYAILSDDYFSKHKVAAVLQEHFQVKALSGLGLGDYDEGVTASGALLSYLREMLKDEPSNITSIHPYANGLYMLLDSAAMRNLELTETLREKKKTGSLLGVLDRTKTAMGARKLREFLEQPLLDEHAINDRYDTVEELIAHEMEREELKKLLGQVFDLERLITRITYKSANPRDLLSFRDSIGVLLQVKELLAGFRSKLMRGIDADLDPLEDLCRDISVQIAEDPPISLHDGNIIRDGFDETVDSLRLLKTDSKQYLAQIETGEREKTGIKTLRIKYNKVFGYYLEVTNSYLDQVPDYFIRKQTLTNAERFVTPELKELEEKILTATDRLTALEFALFEQLRGSIAANIARVQRTAKAVALLDAYLSLADVAVHRRYVRPVLTKDGCIDIKNGRHPVVETMSSTSKFIPNDALLNGTDEKIAIITGPNMAGKSTYMRQCALIVLMAQMGSFVPADAARISVCDRIFTRVGASDDLSAGQSTFMVEMTEVANILRNATRDSLLILDEIGRGTSTFDGLSIAWAVVEYIAAEIGAKTFFATHYHELTKLQGKLYGVKNYRIAVREQGSDIIFLRKIMPGGADKSYGISVAALSGVPDAVVSRARMISEELGGYNADGIVEKVSGKSMSGQMSIFDLGVRTEETDDKEADGAEPKSSSVQAHTRSAVEKALEALEPDSLTPREALQELYRLKELLSQTFAEHAE